MTLPTDLQQIIDEALVAVKQHPLHDLNLGYRHAIYSSLGELHTTHHSPDTIGHKRRALLSISTVRHVLPFWEQARPMDTLPHRLLAIAEEVMDGKIDEIKAKQMLADIDEGPWAYMETINYIALTENIENPSFSYAGFGAAHALGVALYDERFDPTHIDYNLLDNDVDEHQWDTAFYAAYAASNGAVWLENSEAIKRHTFWKWWLTEAPTAWASFSDS